MTHTDARPPDPPRRPAFGRSWALQRIVPPMAAALLLLVTWAAAVEIWQIREYLLPAPQDVAVRLWQDASRLFAALGQTGQAALVGLLLSLVVGTLVSIAFAQSALLRFAFYPYAIFLQTVPIVAIAPLLVMWFGFGSQGVVAVAFILSLFPVIANVTAGLTSVPRERDELLTLYEATRWQRLVKLQIPSAIPDLMTGLKTSSGLSVIGAIVGEFFVGYSDNRFGLGYVIRSAAESYQTDRLFAAVILSTLLGVVVFASVSIVSEGFLKRWGRT